MVGKRFLAICLILVILVSPGMMTKGAYAAASYGTFVQAGSPLTEAEQKGYEVKSQETDPDVLAQQGGGGIRDDVAEPLLGIVLVVVLVVLVVAIAGAAAA